MGRAQALIVALAAAFLALVLGTWSLRGSGPGSTRPGSGAPAGEALPRPAPELRLSGPDGATVALEELRGRAVLVNFWATWCPPCVEETPSLERLARELAPRGLVVLGVSVDEDVDAVRRFVAAQGVGYPVLLDPRRTTSWSWGTEKYPETYLVDAEGQVVRKWIGAVDWGAPAVRAEIAARLPRAPR